MIFFYCVCLKRKRCWNFNEFWLKFDFLFTLGSPSWFQRRRPFRSTFHHRLVRSQRHPKPSQISNQPEKPFQIQERFGPGGRLVRTEKVERLWKAKTDTERRLFRRELQRHRRSRADRSKAGGDAGGLVKQGPSRLHEHRATKNCCVSGNPIWSLF